MPLLNCSKCRDNGNNDHRDSRFQKHGQRNSKKKQKTSHFICHGVRKKKLFVHHQSRNLVDDLDGDNHSSPYPQPCWKCQDRYQFPAATSHKTQIRQTVQYRSRFAFATESSGKITVHHIADATSKINGPKGNTPDIEKQQANGSQKRSAVIAFGRCFIKTLYPITKLLG